MVHVFAQSLGPFASEPRVPSSAEQAGLGRELAAVIARLPTVLEEEGREPASGREATAADLVDVKGRLELGAPPAEPTGGGKRSVDVVLGVDLGTSSVKIVARLPYEAGSPLYAVPVPTFARAEGHPYLWAARLWLGRDGTFSLLPLADAAAVYCTIKAGLMLAPATATGKAPKRSTSSAPTPEEVATAFLALQVRQARGWLAVGQPSLGRRGRLVWSYNFGFPAASLDEIALRDRYRLCVAAALSLADAAEIKVSAVRKVLAKSRLGADGLLEAFQAALVSEIAAAVAGLASSSMLDDGLYGMVDVGAGTVDCCTFSLFKTREGSARCPIFRAAVETLGVEPWRQCLGRPELVNYFRWVLRTQQRQVIWRTKTIRDPKSERWKQGLPVFFVGGGTASDVHAAAVERLDGWLRDASRGSGGVRILRLPPPQYLHHEACAADQVHRLAVAVGLSVPAADIPEVRLPKGIDDITPEQVEPIEGRFIGKEQV